jgi:hypothetical protein
MDQTTVITPKTTYNPSLGLPVDFRVDTERLQRGAPARNVGIVAPDSLSLPLTHFFCQVVKTSGLDVHRYPVGFEAIGQMAADNQYSLSPYARNKVCVLSFRQVILQTDEPLIGYRTHIHFMPWYVELLAQSFVFCSEAKRGRFFPRLLFTDPTLSKSEYLYTNIEPTLVQVERSATGAGDIVSFSEANSSEGGNAGSLKDQSRIKVERVPEHSLTLLTTDVFHRAPQPSEVAKENLGKSRALVSITYISSRFLKI